MDTWLKLLLSSERLKKIFLYGMLHISVLSATRNWHTFSVVSKVFHFLSNACTMYAKLDVSCLKDTTANLSTPLSRQNEIQSSWYYCWRRTFLHLTMLFSTGTTWFVSLNEHRYV